jgi:hypothetical protein
MDQLTHDRFASPGISLRHADNSVTLASPLNLQKAIVLALQTVSKWLRLTGQSPDMTS